MAAFSKLAKHTNSNLYSTRLLVITTSAISLTYWTYNILKRKKFRHSIDSTKDFIDKIFIEKENTSKLKPNSFTKMFEQLKYILKLILGIKEYSNILVIALLLISKTIFDIWVMSNGTQIEGAIISGNMNKFRENIVKFFIAMPSLAVTNDLLKFFLTRLKINLRYNLSVLLYEKYVKGLTFYRLNVLNDQFKNIDQLLTSDVERFSSIVVDIYPNISKPLLDIVAIVYQLSITYTGIQTPGVMMVYLLIAGFFLTNLRKPLIKLTVKESNLEGHLRNIHSRLIDNCEEISFYQGNDREKLTLLHALSLLKSHLNIISNFKFNIDFIDSLIAKYGATVVGYLSLAFPFFTKKYGSQSFRLEHYYKSGRLMVKLSESIARFVLVSQNFSKLAAYTQKMITFLRSLDQNDNLLCNKFLNSSGKIAICDPSHSHIVFENVPLCTPSGDILVKSLNFSIEKGKNVIINGPNGSGKSSLFRIIAELWPACEGKIIKPPNNKIFYIPQKPYLVLGTLRDQIIYPDTIADMRKKHITDNNLMDILNKVELTYLLERDLTFDSVMDWQDILSGGEKQRIAIAKLIYSRPFFAILDECTSAVSSDIEKKIYGYLTTQTECTLISITHRVAQLQEFHQYILRFDGSGGYTYEKIEDAILL